MKKLKILLTNAPKFNLEKFNRNTNSVRAYNLYPPIQLTTIAAAIMKKVDDNPKLIKRPIVTTNKKAIIGRPPENVLSLFD